MKHDKLETCKIEFDSIKGGFCELLSLFSISSVLVDYKEPVELVFEKDCK